MEGATGLDTEFVLAGEPFPAVIFGFVPGPTLNRLPAGGTGTHHAAWSRPSRSTCRRRAAWRPARRPSGAAWPAPSSTSRSPNPWVALTDLDNGDTAVWVGQGDANGSFDIPDVPAGNYTLTWWDEPQNYILDLVNVTVSDGETVDMGILR